VADDGLVAASAPGILAMYLRLGRDCRLGWHGDCVSLNLWPSIPPTIIRCLKKRAHTLSLRRSISQGTTPAGACDTTAVRPRCVHMFMTRLVGGGRVPRWPRVGAARTRGRREKDDLGTISDSWVNQHRANTNDQSQ
jgi:hypothetical protein